MISDKAIRSILGMDDNADNIAAKLIEESMNAGGKDNATAIIIDIL